jgi:hypothetical protein
MRRLGKNIGRYLGDTVDIEVVLRGIESAARSDGWEIESFLKSDRVELKALHRGPASSIQHPTSSIYLSAGIHGDEPAGPLAIQQLLQEDVWPPDCEFWICPCLNPTGFPSNSRENWEGLDLNRQYLEPKADETIAHIAWLQRQPKFDLTLVLHEDWEAHGFYIYELNPDDQPSLAPLMLEAVKECCPIDLSEMIEGRPATGGLIRPDIDPRSRPQWPESFYLLQHKTRHSYTLEAPSDFPLSVRRKALVVALKAALIAISSGFEKR